MADHLATTTPKGARNIPATPERKSSATLGIRETRLSNHSMSFV